jgi:hypothetical protein
MTAEDTTRAAPGAFDAPTGDPDPDERAREAVAHLQRASLEFIDAARALLDVAEEAVREPGGVMAIVAETVGGLAGALAGAGTAWPERGRTGRGRAAGAGPKPGSPPADAGPSDAGPSDPGDTDPGRPSVGQAPRQRPGVEHIRIS